MSREFPEYETHKAAKSWGCFQCCADLNNQPHDDAGYPPGHGQYRVRCPACDISKFYDLRRKVEDENLCEKTRQ